jgi:hypothetical protein
MLMPLRLRSSPHAIAFLLFLAAYFVLLQIVRNVSWRDPGSYFFDPVRAFERSYSLRREAEAEDFIANATAHSFAGNVKAGRSPSFCVGIPTVQRDGARYFRRALGSVLAGLTALERRDILVVPFIVNVDPSKHEAYSEPWLGALSDEVLTYTNADEQTVKKATQLERELTAGFGVSRKKGTFDYTHLLGHCYDKGTDWILLVEDDSIAADGWYKRTVDGLSSLVEKRDFSKTVYLRLFYNERLLGWNSEETNRYVTNVILTELLVLVAGVVIMKLSPKLAATILTPITLVVIISIVTPMCILLYFLAGRLTVAGPSCGINRMDTYGCCSQAFVFPRGQVPGLLSWYKRNENGYIDPVTLRDYTQVDSLTEIYANQNGLTRYALTPSMFQHVGGKSTKPTFTTRWGRSNTENIWNFSFERLDGDKLKKQHIR